MTPPSTSPDDFDQRVAQAIQNPRNMGELADADSIGTVGNANCGDMLRIWIKFKDENGKRVIDRASFQAFGCETAIAAASLAMDLIKGKTAAEALAVSGLEFAADLGPLPPTKIHCTQLVEGALRSALDPNTTPAPTTPPPSLPTGPTLSDAFSRPNQPSATPGPRIVFLKPATPPPSPGSEPS